MRAGKKKQKNWCDSCRKYILPIKIFNWWAFFILLLLLFIGGIIYIIYYLVSKGDTCPICRQKKYLRYRKPRETFLQQVSKQPFSQPDTAFKYCPYCGTQLPPSGNYCKKCDSKF